ncbi:MAG: flagellar hook-basal body complex protein [Bradyrhizobium sp.]|nr:flagellar hook-basal body complex protein [Bradyrhizobium sp.]
MESHRFGEEEVRLVGESTLISLSRLMALQRRLDVAANNVANSQTTGYRAQQLSFQEHLKPEKKQEIGEKPERPLSLVDAALPFTSAASGAFRSTGNPLDLAINGNAYFAIQTNQG